MTYDVIHLSPTWSRRVAGRVDRLLERVDSIASIALCRVPSWCWPLLVVASTWPSAAWAVRRLLDDSDDPLGFVALAALLVALWHARRRFCGVPRTGLLAIAALLAFASNLPIGGTPDLVRALVASGALVVALAAIAARGEPIAPYAGLAVLSLPLLSSLQFYAGFPLRVVTAEASRWLLALTGSDVERVGSALMIDGHLVLVDAPCSGVQMAWVGYFTACVTAWLCRVPNRRFLATLPVVGTTVLTGNVLRNTVLVAADADGVAMTDAMHAAVGLSAFALVALVIGTLFVRARQLRPAVHEVRTRSGTATKRSAAWLLCVLATAACLPFTKPTAEAAPVRRDAEWPTRYDGRPIRPLAPSAIELRFAAQFPGSIARFASDTGTIVLRDVDRPTRRLHPAADCYRGLGFAIADERLARIGQGDDAPLWRCFTAKKGRTGLDVCERIVDRDGRAFTDASSWYWAASLGRSRGPWRAVTVATPLPS